MKKTLDEIINRQDYQTINSVLIDRCMTLARKIRLKMQDLEIDSVAGKEQIYEIHTWRCYQGATDTALSVRVHNDEYGDYDYRSLELQDSYHLMGDFHCLVEAASGKQYLGFLNDAREILDWLDEKESSMVHEISQALEDTKELVG